MVAAEVVVVPSKIIKITAIAVFGIRWTVTTYFIIIMLGTIILLSFVCT